MLSQSYVQRGRPLRAHIPGLAKALIALSVIVAVGFLTVFARIMSDMRDSDRHQAGQAAANLVTTIESDIARNIELYDLSLQAVVDGLKMPETNRVGKAVRQLILFDRSATARDLGPIVVLDAEGKMTISSETTDPRPEDFSAYDFFKVHRNDPDAGLYIGKPMVTAEGVYLVGISRRLSSADGSFAGVVAGAIKLSYFHDLFRRISVGPKSVIALMRTDGTIVMRAPFDISYVGRSLSQSPTFNKMRAQAGTSATGIIQATGATDGYERLYAYHRVGSYPLMTVVATSTEEIYAGWQSKVISLGLLLLLLSGATVLLAVLLAFALKRRMIAECELAILATTDSLTGLANRRCFDEFLDLEWKRAAREQTPLALLMIDADHFKDYNDAEGHQAGDEVIKAVGAAIRAHARRPADLAARYGGEEFAVLVPGDSLESAFGVAENIRAHVMSLRESLGAKFPTVSIGVASVVPHPGIAPRELIDAADAALYEAKRKSRNRTERAELQPSKTQAADVTAAA